MTNDPPAFGPADEETPITQFVPEPPDTIEERPVTVPQYPIHLKIEFDPLELDDAQDLSDSDLQAEPLGDVVKLQESAVLSIGILETPEGYTAPEFETFDSTADDDSDLDALFSELSETSSRHSADVAVWCPWLADATGG